MSTTNSPRGLNSNDIHLTLSWMADTMSDMLLRSRGHVKWQTLLGRDKTSMPTWVDLINDIVDRGDDPRPLAHEKCNHHYLDGMHKAFYSGNILSAPWTADLLDLRWIGVRTTAHTLAHHRRTDPLRSVAFHSSLGRMAREYRKAVAELTLARMLGLPMTLKETWTGPFDNGVRVVAVEGFGYGGDPKTVRASQAGVEKINPMRDLAMIYIGVTAGADPVSTLCPGRAVHPMDQYAYTPRSVHVLGWCPAAYAGLSWPREFADKANSSRLIPIEALLPPDSLPGLFKMLPPGLAVSSTEPSDLEHALLEAEDRTPILPCPWCYMRDNRIDDGPVKPRGFAPSTLTKKNADWIVYIDKVKKALKTAEASAEQFSCFDNASRKALKSLRTERRRAALAHDKRLKELERMRK